MTEVLQIALQLTAHQWIMSPLFSSLLTLVPDMGFVQNELMTDCSWFKSLSVHCGSCDGPLAISV